MNGYDVSPDFLMFGTGSHVRSRTCMCQTHCSTVFGIGIHKEGTGTPFCHEMFNTE